MHLVCVREPSCEGISVADRPRSDTRVLTIPPALSRSAISRLGETWYRAAVAVFPAIGISRPKPDVTSLGLV